MQPYIEVELFLRFQFLIGRMKTEMSGEEKQAAVEFQFLIGRMKTYFMTIIIVKLQ